MYKWRIIKTSIKVPNKMNQKRMKYLMTTKKNRIKKYKEKTNKKRMDEIIDSI